MDATAGAFFTSIYFYGLLAFLALGVVIIIFGFAIRPTNTPLNANRLRKAGKRLRVFGFSTLNLDEQEITSLYSYIRRINTAFNFGEGIGVIAGTCVSIGLGWLIAIYEPIVTSISVAVIESLLFIPIAMGLVFGVDLFLMANFAHWQRQPGNEQRIPMTRIPFSLFRPWWLLIIGLGALIASAIFSAVLITGVVPTEPISLLDSANNLTIPPPLWLLLAPPIAVAILLLTMEVGARLSYHMRWPAPDGIAHALAERARQRMRLQMIITPVTFPFYVMWMLLTFMVFLAKSDLFFGVLFLGSPLLLVGIAGITYIYSATARLWKLIPLPDEEKQPENGV